MNVNDSNYEPPRMDARVLDRRNTSWMTLYGALFLNRRRNGRRDGDELDAYTDWYGFMPLITAVSIALLCFADAFFTTVLISQGAVEMNVLMDWLIKYDLYTFAVVKMSVTGIALLILVMHYNFRIYRVIQVRYILLAFLSMYILLIFHELRMLANI